MQFKDLKIKELENLVLDLYNSIYVIECYGTKDMINLDNGILELENRGYQIDFDNNLSIYKE